MNGMKLVGAALMLCVLAACGDDMIVDNGKAVSKNEWLSTHPQVTTLTPVDGCIIKRVDTMYPPHTLAGNMLYVNVTYYIARCGDTSTVTSYTNDKSHTPVPVIAPPSSAAGR